MQFDFQNIPQGSEIQNMDFASLGGMKNNQYFVNNSGSESGIFGGAPSSTYNCFDVLIQNNGSNQSAYSSFNTAAMPNQDNMQ